MSEVPDALQSLPFVNMLPPDLRERVIERFESVAFTFGSVIIREGEAGDAFYVLASGRARVVKRAANGDEVALGVLRPGDSFGEAALLGDGVRGATVRASGNCEVFRLSREGFAELIATNPEIRAYFELQMKRRAVVNFFRQHATFSRLPPKVILDLVARLQPVDVQAGALVVQERGEVGGFYVVDEGRVRLFKGDERSRRDIAFLRRGDFFAQGSLVPGGKSPYTAAAVSTSRLFVVSPRDLDGLVEASAELRAMVEERISQIDFERVAKVPLDFAAEIVPAQAKALPAVSDDQVEEDVSEEAPFASPEGHFIRKPGRIRRFPLVRQVDEADCGAAALAMVCRHFGRRVSLARIRKLVHTSIDGASLRGLCSAATEIGLAARSVKASRGNLQDMPLPAIVHWQGDHWIVLYDTSETHVRVADPAIGLRRIRREEFDRHWTGYAALFDYTAALERAPEDTPGVGWLWQFFRPHAVTLGQAVFLAVVVSALQMVLPVFTQIIVDSVLVDGDSTLLVTLIAGMLALLVFSTIAMIVQRYFLSFVALQLDSAALDFVVRRMLSLPMTYFATRRTGDIQRRLDGVREIRQFIVQHGANGLMAAVQLLTAMAVMTVYSGALSATFFATLPLYGLLMLFSTRRLRPVFDDLEEAASRYRSYQIDAIKGVETVKAMGAERQFRDLMLGEFLRVSDKRFNADFTVLLYEGAVGVVSFLSTVMFLWVGASQVMAGQLTIGALVAFNSLLGLANQPILILLFLWDNWQVASVLVNRLNDVLVEEPEQGEDRSRLLPVPTLEGRISFDRVGFRYGGPESPPILLDVSFEARAGKTIAIVGRSGSGKTTLIKCLAGLLEPTEGTIYYDGVDLKTLNYRDLRRQIGFVLQENFLFSDTIARNIALGEEEPDMDRVIAAASAAAAREFIEGLPLGYETQIGESGIAISGGQRQRIAIARAVYHRPAVLVLDEATSALDTESERAVKENLHELLRGRTSFVIAHRLSTIRDADLIIVLEKGQIVETGAHEELMKRQGLYYYLVSQQLGL